MNVRPERCAAPECGRMGEALIEKYEIVPDGVDKLGIMQPSGEWIWLCGPHAVEEFA